MNILETHRILPVTVPAGCDLTIQQQQEDGTYRTLTTFHAVKQGGTYDTVLLISNDISDELSLKYESGGLGVLMVKEAS